MEVAKGSLTGKIKPEGWYGKVGEKSVISFFSWIFPGRNADGARPKCWIGRIRKRSWINLSLPYPGVYVLCRGGGVIATGMALLRKDRLCKANVCMASNRAHALNCQPYPWDVESYHSRWLGMRKKCSMHRNCCPWTAKPGQGSETCSHPALTCSSERRNKWRPWMVRKKDGFNCVEFLGGCRMCLFEFDGARNNLQFPREMGIAWVWIN